MPNKETKSRRNRRPVKSKSGGKGNAHSNFVRLRTRTRALRDMKTKPLMAVVATHVFVAVAPPPEGATPADTISSPLISGTAVAPALL